MGLPLPLLLLTSDFTLTHLTGPPSSPNSTFSGMHPLPGPPIWPPAPAPVTPLLTPHPGLPLPCPPSHPLFLGDAFPQEDAGGAHGKLHGGAGHGAPGTRLKAAPPPSRPPWRVGLPYLPWHSFAKSSCLSGPLPQSGSQCPRVVTAGAEISPEDGEGSELFLPPHLA